MMDRVESAFGERTFRAIGTTAAVVVLDPAKAETAEAILRDEINSIDLACSRFRPDSELAYLHSQSGRTTVVSPLLFGALTVAIAVAEKTHGAVDPTVGNAMSALGYDRDFDHIGAISPRVTDALGPIVGFRHIHLDMKRDLSVFPEECGSTSDLLRKPGPLIGPHSGWRISSGPASWSASGAM